VSTTNRHMIDMCRRWRSIQVRPLPVNHDPPSHRGPVQRFSAAATHSSDGAVPDDPPRFLSPATASRPKRTQAPVDTVDKTTGCVPLFRSSLHSLWSSLSTRPPSAHEGGFSTPRRRHAGARRRPATPVRRLSTLVCGTCPTHRAPSKAALATTSRPNGPCFVGYWSLSALRALSG
jgi:hypothetical protein